MARTLSDFTIKFRAGTVDRAAGVIRGAVVAESDVAAKGHFGWIDANGVFTRDEKLGVKKIPLFMDAKSIATGLESAMADGGRFRVRSDHADSLGARGGFADNFRVEGGKLLTDINLFDGYSDREIVMESAEKTPELIGLSLDFGFRVDVEDNKALVRITNINAVDIVDEGAVTPNGLFRSVRITGGNTQLVDTFSKETPDTSTPTKMDQDIKDAFAQLNAVLAPIVAAHADSEKAKAKLAAEDDEKKKAELAAADDEKKQDDKMSAIVEKALTAKFTALQKDMLALGVKPAAAPAADDAAAIAQSAKLKAEADMKADPVAHFNSLVAEERKTAKSATEANHNAVAKHPAAFRAKLKAQGIAS